MKEHTIEQTYEAIGKIIKSSNNPEKDFETYKKKIGDKHTDFQWKVIEDYFKVNLRKRE